MSYYKYMGESTRHVLSESNILYYLRFQSKKAFPSKETQFLKWLRDSRKFQQFINSFYGVENVVQVPLQFFYWRTNEKQVNILLKKMRNLEPVKRHNISVDFEIKDVRKQFSLSRAKLQKVLKLAQQHGDISDIATKKMNLGLYIAVIDESLEQGRPLIEDALQMFIQIGDVTHIGACHGFLGDIDSSINRQQAIDHYREALRCFEQVGSSDAQEIREELQKLGVTL